jgi:hypothetical protein
VDLETGVSLFSIIGNTRFTLLLTGTDPETVKTARVLAEQYAEILQVYSLDGSPAFSAGYGIGDTPVIYLMRPDGYIGFRCLSVEIGELEKFLAEMLIAV